MWVERCPVCGEVFRAPERWAAEAARNQHKVTHRPTDPAWPCRHCGSRDHNTGWHDHRRTEPTERESG